MAVVLIALSSCTVLCVCTSVDWSWLMAVAMETCEAVMEDKEVSKTDVRCCVDEAVCEMPVLALASELSTAIARRRSTLTLLATLLSTPVARCASNEREAELEAMLMARLFSALEARVDDDCTAERALSTRSEVELIIRNALLI